MFTFILTYSITLGLLNKRIKNMNPSKIYFYSFMYYQYHYQGGSLAKYFIMNNVEIADMI